MEKGLWGGGRGESGLRIREVGSGWVDLCIFCREGYVKDIGFVLKVVGVIDKKW